ncbi:MAG: hypothetical protein NTW71_14340, partial [Deltaproteobacteria bacterium]|nr:hypothetical protein [Deltaproteobacteria bacterium]
MAKGSKRKASDNQKKADKMPAGPAPSAAFFLKQTVHILIIVILGMLIYSNTFKVPLVLDDFVSFFTNSDIQNLGRYLDPKSLLQNRIIVQLTFALNIKMHGFHVVGYHVFNLFIHLLNALLVYWLMVFTFRTPYASACLQKDISKTSDFYRCIPLFAALVFVSHPVQTQAVTYI